ncbi:MAG: prolyl oligopeptidase family serine peptidase [Chloroflexi bacterium]|nr:prolyl oligopeptidase family serine peptidase [Chloroflexota bacterium]
MNNFRLPAAAIVVVLAVVSCKRSASAPGKDIPRLLDYDGRERGYILHTPKGFDEETPAPVVFVFHGGGGNAENAIRMSGMNEIADREGFLVVYPNGSGRLDDKVLTWNGGTCCGFAQENNIDDVGFTRAVLSDLQEIAQVDPKRIYAAGMSNGGTLSYRLACEAADIFAAIAPVAGTQNLTTCVPSEPVSLIHFHGTDDRHLPYEGGVGAESLTGAEYVSVKDSIDFWIGFNGCNSQPQTNSFEDVQHQVWKGCARGSSVELYAIVGGKHAWPGSSGPGWLGGDEPTQSISASELIWEFFAAHPKP